MAEIDLQNLEDKIKVLDEDIQKVNELLVKLEKDKVNALATMNALQGAKSQLSLIHISESTRRM